MMFPASSIAKKIGLWVVLALMAIPSFALVPEDQLNLTVPYGTTLDISLNATNVQERGTLTFFVPAQTSVGQLVMDSPTSNIAHYTPADGFWGIETLRFAVTDGVITREGLLRINVLSPNVQTALYLGNPNSGGLFITSVAGYGNLALNFNPRSFFLANSLPSGEYDFYYVATNDGGGTSMGQSRHRVDVTPPVLTWQNYPGFPGSNQCVAGNITMDILAIDNFNDCPADDHMQGVVLIDPHGGSLRSFTRVNSECGLYAFLPAYDTRVLQDGIRTFEAFGSDVPGNESEHISFNLKVDNTPPQISYPTSFNFDPVLPSHHTIKGTINITLSATDITCGMQSLQMVLQSNNTIPLTPQTPGSNLNVQWNTQNFLDGAYVLIGKAWDNVNNLNTDQTPTLIVDNTSPLASITFPVNGSTVSGDITISAVANDVNGVSRVEFFSGNTLLGVDTQAPYSQFWPTGNQNNGPTTVRIVAYDLVNNVTAITHNVTINNQDPTPPSSALLSPAAGSYVKGTIQVSGTASDNVAVTKVQLLVDNLLRGEILNPSSNFEFSWNTQQTSNGARILQLKAFDAFQFSLSAPVSVTVDNAAPTTQMINPSNNASLNGTITLSANATDNIGVTEVKFFREGEILLGLGTANGNIYTIPNFDTTTLSEGVHTFWTTARDAAGNQTTSAAVNATVNNIDNEPPTMQITFPTHGAGVYGTVAVAGTATDNVAVNRVEFYVDGLMAATDFEAPYGFSWNTSLIVNGTHNLEARAYDSSNMTPHAIQVSVDNGAPTVNVTAPTSGAVVSGNVTIEGNANDNVAVTKVEFYDGVVRIGEIFPAASMNVDFSWIWENTTNGEHTFQVKAFDAAGNEGMSSPVNVQVTGGQPDNTPPTVQITQPLPNATVSGLVLISAIASDNVGVDHVELTIDGVSQTIIYGPGPYAFEWNTVGLTGVHELAAQATDGAGNPSSISLVQVTVVSNQPDVISPITEITTPAENSWAKGSLLISANAFDNVGVTHVDLFVDGGFKTSLPGGSSPYNFTLNTIELTDTIHSIETRAFDAANNVGVDMVNIRVDNEAPNVGIIAPASESTVFGTVLIEALAMDNGVLHRVDFFIDDVSIGSVSGTGPLFQMEWNSATVPGGSHQIRVKAFDEAGNMAASDVVSVSVENNDTTPPVAILTAPTEGSFVHGVVTLGATASDNLGVQRVEFLKGEEFLGSDTSIPYTFAWNTTGIPLENIVLRARAVDFANNTGLSNPVAVTVDNVIPQISNFVPAHGATISEIQAFQFSAQDNSQLDRMELWVNNQLTAMRTSFNPPNNGSVGYSFDTTTLPNGSYPLEARVYDKAGNLSSETHQVNFQNVGGPSNPPIVQVLYPANNAAISSIVDVLAQVDNNPTEVVFVVDGGVPQAPTQVIGNQYTYRWITTLISDGPHTVEVRATNSAGVTSVVVPVTVDNTAPTINWVYPDQPQSVLFWAVNLIASVSDNNPTLDYVRFKLNQETLASFINSPQTGDFSYLFDTLAEVPGQAGVRRYPDGNYSLLVTASDAAGNVANASIPIIIDNVNIPNSEGSLEVHPADDAFVIGNNASQIWVHPVNASINPQHLNANTFRVTYFKDGREQQLSGSAIYDNGDVRFSAIVPPNSRVTNVTAQFIDMEGKFLAANWEFIRAMDATAGGVVKSADDRITVTFPANSLTEHAYVDIDTVEPNEMPSSMIQANQSSSIQPNGQIWQNPYWITAVNSEGNTLETLTSGVEATFLFEEEINQIPEPSRSYIFQPQTLVLGEDPYWRPLTGSGVLGSSDQPGIKTVSAPIGQLGYFRVTFFPAPAPGISEVFNFPNPFSPQEGGTDFTYLLGEDSKVSIIIYDLIGNLVKKMDIPHGASGGQAGQNIVHWSGHNGEGVEVANGGYIIQLLATSGSGKTTKIRHKAAVAK